MKPYETYDWFVGSTSTESTCLSVKLYVNNLADQSIIETYIGIHGTQPTHIYTARYPSNNLGFQLGFEGVSYLVHLGHMEKSTNIDMTHPNKKQQNKQQTKTKTSKMDPRNKSWSSEKKLQKSETLASCYIETLNQRVPQKVVSIPLLQHVAVLCLLHVRQVWGQSPPGSNLAESKNTLRRIWVFRLTWRAKVSEVTHMVYGHATNPTILVFRYRYKHGGNIEISWNINHLQLLVNYWALFGVFWLYPFDLNL